MAPIKDEFRDTIINGEIECAQSDAIVAFLKRINGVAQGQTPHIDVSEDSPEWQELVKMMFPEGSFEKLRAMFEKNLVPKEK